MHLISNGEDKTLHLPRILCLHGGGTNARIFRAQCRALEKALSSTFRFCYAEGKFPSEPGSDVTAVYQELGPFRAWIDAAETNPEVIATALRDSIQQAILQDNERHATGPFVGLLGFSQGAKVCASLLRDQQMSNQRNSNHLSEKTYEYSLPQWHFSVLLAGRGPLLQLTSEVVEGDTIHEITSLYEDSAGKGIKIAKGLITIPTIHVHGVNDPGLPQHQKLLYEHFDIAHARLVEWDGQHRVPLKSKDVLRLVKEINGMWACFHE